jgi:electron transfer flavoprotein alpha subunit
VLGNDPAVVKRAIEALAQAVQHTGAQVLLLASNRRGRELAGRVAQALEAGCLTDVMALEVRDGQLLAVRNALGGAVLATQRVLTPRQVMALAPGAWPAAAPAAGGTVQELKVEVPSSPLRLVETRPRPAAEADIEGARVLVAVGLGLAPEDLPLAQQVAQALGGEIACSKPVATDRKWLPEERVIGLSGKKCKPELALLLGISGQVQFTVGIRDARTIVAVNRDENAPILTMADYAMVADLKDVLPALGPGL